MIINTPQLSSGIAHRRAKTCAATQLSGAAMQHTASARQNRSAEDVPRLIQRVFEVPQ